jgi:2-iminobutanoate/2-iminopropanoate deaminase
MKTRHYAGRPAGGSRRVGSAGGPDGIFGLAGADANRTAPTAESQAEARTPIRYASDEEPLPGAPPLSSGATVHAGFVFVAGKAGQGERDIRTHTESVLAQLEAELVRAGSSMDKVLKVNVYLHNLRDYDGMNDAYRGRFGDRPPARSTVACYHGIPGDSLVQMDCIAAL